MRWPTLAGCALGGAIVLASAAAAKEPPYWGDMGNLIGFGMVCDVIQDRQEMYRNCFGKAARALGWDIDDAYVSNFLGQMGVMSSEGRYDNQMTVCASVDSVKDQLIGFDRLVERCGK